jgi:hypothetical protein
MRSNVVFGLRPAQPGTACARRGGAGGDGGANAALLRRVPRRPRGRRRVRGQAVVTLCLAQPVQVGAGAGARLPALPALGQGHDDGVALVALW